ncbi:uncharacterized protein LOC110850487 isoform X1 [Folsomia candida]|uniref:uncharacterized protein LOC110850487 isoform X1 n=2 Tax=Folsomia candida TaxID=158441 RepID=UPI000B8F6959|nr:uncharacterized protein LOC110850487 isoform X1 [Folsomia candida]
MYFPNTQESYKITQMAPPWVKVAETEVPKPIVSRPPWVTTAVATPPHPFSLPKIPSEPPSAGQIQCDLYVNGQNQNFPRPSAIQTSGQSPNSLAIFLQQAPLRTPSAAVEQEIPQQSQPCNKIKKPAPVAAGPLAGAKFVLPPLPVRQAPKPVTGKTDRELARIASLRQSVRPRPDDITSLLLEIQRGMKLNHVPCDDRSKPLVRRCQTFYPEF